MSVRGLAWDFGPVHTCLFDGTFFDNNIFKLDQLHQWELMKFGSGSDTSAILLPIVSAALKILFPVFNPDWNFIWLERQMGINETCLDLASHVQSYFYIIKPPNHPCIIEFIDASHKNILAQTLDTKIPKPIRLPNEENQKWQARLKAFNKKNIVAAMKLVIHQQTRDVKKFKADLLKPSLDFTHIFNLNLEKRNEPQSIEMFRLTKTESKKKMKLDDKADAYFMCAAEAMTYFMKQKQHPQNEKQQLSNNSQVISSSSSMTMTSAPQKKKPPKKRKKTFQPSDISIIR